MDRVLSVVASGLLIGGVYALIAVGLNLVFGVLRIVNFAHGALVMLGMYGAWICVTQFGIPVYASVVLVAPALFVIGLVLQKLLLAPLQNQPNMQIFATFGLLIVIENAVLAATRGESYSVPHVYAGAWRLGAVTLGVDRLLIFGVATLITIALSWFLRSTMAGKAVRAITQDRTAARLMGINVQRAFLLTFGLGAALAGVGGVMLAPVYSLTPTIGDTFIIAAFAVVVLGGLGSVAGAYVGGLLVGVLESLAGFYIDPSLKQAIWFVIFIIALVVRPAGLFGKSGAQEVGLRQVH
ncbi:branched-chain amino acid ABC transporter permease [soil metagenome]